MDFNPINIKNILFRSTKVDEVNLMTCFGGTANTNIDGFSGEMKPSSLMNVFQSKDQ
jgi:hypothetical protein